VGASGSSTRWEERLARGGPAVAWLALPAGLYSLAVRARGAAYDRGLCRSWSLGVPVVCAGNLTTGGTGKTPFVAWLVRELAQRGFRPGILSRGYRSGPQGTNEEAELLAELCPGVPHVQDPDRVRGGRALVAQERDVVVLDDGFQHRRLARDLDLVLVDATRPWGLAAHDGREATRALLPRGLLREPPEALARAHALVVTRSDAVPAESLAALERELAEQAPGRPIVLASHAPRAFVDEAGRASPLDSLRGATVDAVSAIGNPAAFEGTLRALGLSIGEHRVFADHHRYARAELDGLGQHRPLVTTQKDAVKLRPLGLGFRALAIEFAIRRDAAVLEALLDALPRRGETVVQLPARRKLRD